MIPKSGNRFSEKIMLKQIKPSRPAPETNKAGVAAGLVVQFVTVRLLRLEVTLLDGRRRVVKAIFERQRYDVDVRVDGTGIRNSAIKEWVAGNNADRRALHEDM